MAEWSPRHGPGLVAIPSLLGEVQCATLAGHTCQLLAGMACSEMASRVEEFLGTLIADGDQRFVRERLRRRGEASNALKERVRWRSVRSGSLS